MVKKLIRLTESDLHRIVKEPIKRILKEEKLEKDLGTNILNINTNKVMMAKRLIRMCGGYIEISEDDRYDLQIYDGGFDEDGEAHEIESIDNNGCNMDDGEHYSFEELTPTDLDMIIDYIKEVYNL